MSNTTRRRLLSTVVGTSTGILLATDGVATHALAQATSTPTPNAKQVDSPSWSFVLNEIDDPFTGKLVFPTKAPAGQRVIRAEVIIVNASDQPLDFQTSKVHLVDSEGIEYAAGNAQGSDPSLVSQTLPNGERSRGMVWFLVPASAEMTQIKFYGPTPQLKINLQAK